MNCNEIKISVYDAGPAVFDYSNLNAEGRRDPHVIRDQHRSIAEQLAEELCLPQMSICIHLVFPTDTPFVPSQQEIEKPALFSSRIAASCESDIRKCDIMIANVSPWPKRLEGRPESVMADEGTVYEAGYASGYSDAVRAMIIAAQTNPLIAEALPALFRELGLPKIIVPYNESLHTLEERMTAHYGGEVYNDGPLTFSKADHTMIEAFGDPNNAMIANLARKQKLQIEKDFKSALRAGVKRFMTTTHNLSLI